MAPRDEEVLTWHRLVNPTCIGEPIEFESRDRDRFKSPKAARLGGWWPSRAEAAADELPYARSRAASAQARVEELERVAAGGEA